MILIKRALLEKLKEALVSVLPVTVIVFLVSLTPAVSFSLKEYLVFAVSALLMIAGIGLFNLGADLAMTPMGEHVGEGLTKSKRIGILLSVSLVMGILITIAEPDLSVLAGQVSAVIVPGVLITAVGAGVGLFLLLAVIKIILRYNLNALLFFFYMVLFMLSAVMLEHGKNSLLPLAFDSGGVTTGPVTVPFIMALGVGIAQTVGGRRAHENSFGLVALCSVGPIVAVLALCITASGSIDYAIPDYSIPDNLGPEILFTLAHTAREVARSLLLIFAFFGVLQLFVLHLSQCGQHRLYADRLSAWPSARRIRIRSADSIRFSDRHGGGSGRACRACAEYAGRGHYRRPGDKTTDDGCHESRCRHFHRAVHAPDYQGIFHPLLSHPRLYSQSRAQLFYSAAIHRNRI